MEPYFTRRKWQKHTLNVLDSVLKTWRKSGRLAHTVINRPLCYSMSLPSTFKVLPRVHSFFLEGKKALTELMFLILKVCAVSPKVAQKIEKHLIKHGTIEMEAPMEEQVTI